MMKFLSYWNLKTICLKNSRNCFEFLNTLGPSTSHRKRLCDFDPRDVCKLSVLLVNKKVNQEGRSNCIPVQTKTN